MNRKISTSQEAEQTCNKRCFSRVLITTLIILWFFLPVMQTLFNMVPPMPLDGVESAPPSPPKFTITKWLSGKYQHKLEKWYRKRIGFRDYFIRLDNQINFSIFNECSSYADGIVVGRDNWLFEKTYINSLNNTNPVKIKGLESRVKKMKQLQDALATHGIYFIFLISPSKATIYGEYLKEKQLKNPFVSETALYTSTKKLLDSHSINYLDGHEFFMRRKNNTPYNIFVRGGTHWSYYGASLFSIELVSRIRKDTGIPIGSISNEPILVNFQPRGSDKDIASLMNVFNFEATNGKTAHPTIKAHFPKDAVRPDVLIVGSSFIHTINKFVSNNLFGIRDFYYYNMRNMRKPFQEGSEKIPTRQQLKDVILSKHIIIIENNEDTLDNIGNGFIQNANRVLDGVFQDSS